MSGTLGDTVNSCIFDFILASFDTVTPAGIVDSIGARELFGKNRNTIFTTGFLPYGQDIFSQQISILEGVATSVLQSFITICWIYEKCCCLFLGKIFYLENSYNRPG